VTPKAKPNLHAPACWTAPLPAAPYKHFQSRRDCVLQPRVVPPCGKLPWEIVPRYANPEGVAAAVCCTEQRNTGRNPFRVEPSLRLPTQGSFPHGGTTLGFGPESLWDSSCHTQLQNACKVQTPGRFGFEGGPHDV